MIAVFLSVGVIVCLILAQQGLHQIQEGHVGVYFNGGAITTRISEPGWHTKMPLMTSYESVQVTV